MKLLDNSSFLILFVTSYASYFNEEVEIDTSSTLISALLATDLFYDVLVATTKTWFLSRLQLYVAVMFYLMYLVLFLTSNSIPFYAWLFLGVRFTAFFTDYFVDLYEDAHLHDVLSLNYNWSWPVLRIQTFDINPNDDLIPLLDKYVYIGSQFSGSLRQLNVDPSPHKNTPSGLCYFGGVIFHVVFLIFLIVLLPIASAIAVPVGLFKLFQMCFPGTWPRGSMLAELRIV